MATSSNLGDVRRVGAGLVLSPIAIIFRTLTGVRVGAITIMAACVVVCRGCCVAMLAFTDAEAVKPTCEDPRHL